MTQPPCDSEFKCNCVIDTPCCVSDDEDIENAGDNVEGLNGGKAGGGAVKAKTKLKTVVPEMSEEDVTKAVEPLILEYFENNDAMEVLYTLQVSGRLYVLHLWFVHLVHRSRS